MLAQLIASSLRHIRVRKRIKVIVCGLLFVYITGECGTADLCVHTSHTTNPSIHPPSPLHSPLPTRGIVYRCVCTISGYFSSSAALRYLCVCVCVCMWDLHVRVCMDVCVCVGVWMDVHACMYLYTHVYECRYTRMYTYILHLHTV